MGSPFLYGGQAVIEGVMIRGQRFVSLAVRRPSGDIALHTRRLGALSTGRWRQVPLLRGIIVLAETLALGMRALTFSTNVALEAEGQQRDLPWWAVLSLVSISLALGMGLFFVAPLLAARALDPLFDSDLLSNLAEGLIRLAVFVAYVGLVGLMPDVRRVFAYHGAEHMAVHAYEAGDALEVSALRKFSPAHARCGTAFLLLVMVVAILIFSFLGRPALVLQVTQRLTLIPVVAAISYELLRFSGTHAGRGLFRLLVLPGLALQVLTTRRPDDAQLEVAICAMKGALASDEGSVAVDAEKGWVPYSPEQGWSRPDP